MAKRLTNDLITAAGLALYGPRWQSVLARELDVADRTIRYWVAGKFDPPQSVLEEIACILREREAEISAVLLKMDMAVLMGRR